jgi:antitoxin MazE
MVTKVQKWGNSQGLRFTKAILEEAMIGIGDEVNVLVRSGRIIVEPVSRIRGKHDIKKLVRQIPKSYRAEELDWGAPIGKEAW